MSGCNVKINQLVDLSPSVVLCWFARLSTNLTHQNQKQVFNAGVFEHNETVVINLVAVDDLCNQQLVWMNDFNVDHWCSQRDENWGHTNTSI
jgi:hypothetical protein